VATQAYVIWERSGKPEGSDFSAQARAELAARVAAGETLQQIENAFNAPAAAPPAAAQARGTTNADATLIKK
jgi:alpha-glucan, water dikinase